MQEPRRYAADLCINPLPMKTLEISIRTLALSHTLAASPLWRIFLLGQSEGIPSALVLSVVLVGCISDVRGALRIRDSSAPRGVKGTLRV